ncbi:XRE family transcriptional regulator [Bradyrhizobium tropiciagri]|uniref:helix-turn-helix domain-containing protein n=1 Tax=Bradyrhizobium tropiciagri TaxID=312253 RepID=UPI001BA66052|nr:XRE family transcriptional regulator [Bradyrhizobium tropiciagri]MBR0873283.1 XRE family transcriptional regulator [Bradyrhizobium tropiciagri]
MTPGKLFIGRRVREIRETAKLTQGAFAERLGISTSYLNQIENNQRPVSASVLVLLADRFGIDFSSISANDSDRVISMLTEALADPVFAPYSPGFQELKLVVQNAPGFAQALLSCHQAYRRNSEQLASLDGHIGNWTVEPTAYEEVRDFFHLVDNYIHELDVSGESLALELGIPNSDANAALAKYLESRHGIRIRRTDPDESALRRFDAASRTLFINPYLPAATRSFQLALQIAALEREEQTEAIAGRAEFRSADAREVCKAGLRNYFAGAVVLPYQQFLTTARDLRHDLELIATRFGASLEQVAHRLSTLQRPGQKGVPVFFARVDRAGNITKRHSAAKLQFARYGAACPLWNVHQAFESPSRIIRQLAETPDGIRFLCVATELAKGHGGFGMPRPRFAIALGCEVSYAREFVYADGLDLTSKSAFDPIGISCRICERANCPQRAVPPLKSKLTIHRNRRDILPYDISH